MKQLLTGFGLAMLVAQPSAAESIQLEQLHGVYMVPVRINDAIKIPFVIDSEAGDISVPEDVFKTLMRSGTVKESDFLQPGTYVLADGTRRSEQRFTIHELRVGNQVVKDVVASVAPDRADPLLGQSFLSRLPKWAIDNSQHVLVLNEAEEAVAQPSQPQAPPTKAPAASSRVAVSLNDICNGDMYSIQVPFLESRIGVARRVNNAAGQQRREYTVDGCSLTAYVQNNEVVGYGLILGGDDPNRYSFKGNCNIEIPGPRGLRTNHLTLGKFIDAMGGTGIEDLQHLLTSRCITDCGNAADPTVTFHWEGPHASAFRRVDLTMVLADDAAINAANRWADIMTKAEGKAYVLNAKFNCDGKYQEIGAQLFRDAEIYQIIVHYGDEPRIEPWPYKSPCGSR